MKTCKICKLEKELTEFNPSSKYKEKIYYRGECKSCNLIKQSSDQAAQIKYRNSDHGKEIKKAYKRTRKYRTQQTQYEIARKKSDPLYRLKKCLRDRLAKALNVKKFRKTTAFYQYIGCSIEELKQHIEKQFQPGMTWENHGKWHLDHIVPLGSAKTEEELFKLAHYTNIQPLWAIDNFKKSNKLT